MKTLKNKFIENQKGGKTILLERRGCNFWDDEPIQKVSDFDNYRYFIHNLITYKKYQINDFEKMHGEITRGTAPNTSHVGAETKQKIKERIKEGKRLDMLMTFSDYQYDKKGMCWGHFHKFYDLLDYYKSEYTTKFFLQFINKISKIKYKNVLIINNLSDIENKLGYREETIYNDLAYLIKFETDETHDAYYFYDTKGSYFIFDFASLQVVG